MYRPENWKNPYAPADYPSGVVSAFEAGADAIIEALKKKGHYITRYGYISASPLLSKLGCGTTAGKAGWIVFVPNKEDENIKP